MSLDRVVTYIAAAALTSGCHIFGKAASDCHSPQEYQRARQVAPLTVPAGMDSPNTQGALAIPTIEATLPPPGSKDACLDVPPRYRAAAPNKAASEAPAPPRAEPAPSTPRLAPNVP